jgi:hypothetical protein
MAPGRDEEALEIGRLVLRLAGLLGIGTVAAPVVYSQHRLPPDVSSADGFLRAHRVQFKAGTPGWTRQGAVRAVTAEAWDAHVAEQGSRARMRRIARVPSVAANDLGEQIDRELGIRVHGGRR